MGGMVLMDLYLIRHTRTQAEPGLCYGASDVPLGATHAEDCAAVLARLPAVEALWSSPLARCRALAESIGVRYDVAPVFDPGLCELDFGEWEGQRWETIDRGLSDAWAEAYWRIAPPGGETYAELYRRVGAVLTRICAGAAQIAAVVTHAGPIRATLAHCLQLEAERYPALRVDHGGIALLRGGPDCWRLEYLNG
jgi:alpha-ribazole phosphatase